MVKIIQEQIEEIIHEIKCSKDFLCYKSEFKNLCKAEDIGLDSFVACLELNPFACKFSIHYGGIFFCHCPLRVYIARKLKK